MHYVLIMLVMFTFSTPAITQPLTHRLLEIRSMPVAQKKAKPIRRLLHRIDRMIRGKSTHGGIDLMIYEKFGGKYRGLQNFFMNTHILTPIRPLVISVLLVPATLLSVSVVAVIALNSMIGIVIIPSMIFAGTGVAISMPAWYRAKEEHLNKMVRQKQHIHFTKLQDGKLMLLRGEVLERDYDTGGLVIQTSENDKRGSTHVLPFNIGGVDIPDHPDLRRSARFIASADDYDYLYVVGKVSKVYNDGHYELEIKHKVDYNLNEYTVDKPHTIFVHASLPEAEGGFVFMDGGIGGVEIPNHPDLHRSVRLITSVDDRDNLYVAGKVSKVYRDGHYEIEIEHKVDYDLNEYTVDEPYTIFMHASLSETEGGLVFMDGGKATEDASNKATVAAGRICQAC